MPKLDGSLLLWLDTCSDQPCNNNPPNTVQTGVSEGSPPAKKFKKDNEHCTQTHALQRKRFFSGMMITVKIQT